MIAKHITNIVQRFLILHACFSSSENVQPCDNLNLNNYWLTPMQARGNHDARNFDVAKITWDWLSCCHQLAAMLSPIGCHTIIKWFPCCHQLAVMLSPIGGLTVTNCLSCCHQFAAMLSQIGCHAFTNWLPFCHKLAATRRYSPLRGLSSSSCGRLRPLAKASFALRAKKSFLYCFSVF